MKNFTMGVGAACAVFLGLAGACSNDETTSDEGSTSSRSAASSTSTSTTSTSSSTSSSTSASTSSNGGGGQGGQPEGGMGGAPAVGGAAGSGGGGTGGGAGGASMAGENCSSPLAASLGTTSLDTTNLANDYSSYSCDISTFQGLGPDAVLSIAVPASQYLAAVHDNAYDGVIFGYDQCDPTIAGACVGGQDSLGELEGFTHQNTTVNSQTIYVFTDGWDSIDYGPVDVALNVYDPAAGGDTCATAIPINKTAAQQVGGVSLAYSYQGFNPDYDLPLTGCTSYTEPGQDVVFSIVLDTTDSLDVTLRPAGGNDTSVYLLVGNCSDPNAQCVAGSDSGFSGDPEYITAYSPTANATTVYIVVDGYLLSQTDDAFLLNVTVQ